MAKYVRRKFKRTFKKRRFTRKRTMTRKKSTINYDGMIKVKMQATRDFNNGDLNGVATMKVRWGNQLLAPSVNTLTIQDCPEWVRYRQLYKKFCIQGLKMEYKPWTYQMGATDVVSEELLVGSSVDGTDPNATNIRLAVDFTCKKASLRHNKYVGVAKSRFKNGSALTGGIGAGSGNQRWLDTVAGSDYSQGRTLFVAQHVGVSAPESCAIMYATWFVWFKI